MGLPHSEIVGSQPAHGSPTLIAAMPRPSSARSAEASTLCSYCLPSRKTSCGSRSIAWSTSSIASTTLLGATVNDGHTLSRSRHRRPRSIQHTLHLVRYNRVTSNEFIVTSWYTRYYALVTCHSGVPSPLNRDDDHGTHSYPCWLWVGGCPPHSLERR